MAAQGFDERYPAMFQPGGEDMAEDFRWPAPAADAAALPVPTVPARSPVLPSMPAPGPAQSSVHVHSPTRMPANPADGKTDGGADEEPSYSAAIARAETTHGGSASTTVKSHWLLWRVPALVAALLVGVGVMVPVVSWWNSRSGDGGEARYANQMWTYMTAPLAAPVVGVGLGIAATLLFLYTQLHPTRREGLRRLFTIATATVLAAGYFAQFATNIVSPVRHESFDSLAQTESYYFSPPDFAGALSLMAFGPLLVGMLMFAALAISKSFALLRMYLVGLLLLAAAGFTFGAQYLFPDVQPSSQMVDGGNQSIPGWLFWMPALTPALLAAATLVFAAALLYPIIKVACLKMWSATSPVQAAHVPTADADADVAGVEGEDDKQPSTPSTEQAADHDQP